MRDRAAERACRRALRVDVDPLVVAGRVGERVDPLLRDLEPLARAELEPRLQVVDPHAPQRTTLAAHV